MTVLFTVVPMLASAAAVSTTTTNTSSGTVTVKVFPAGNTGTTVNNSCSGSCSTQTTFTKNSDGTYSSVTTNVSSGSSGNGNNGNGSSAPTSCSSPANACGAVDRNGTMVNGKCSVQVQTGTNSKGSPTYSWVAITPPALPTGYGTACNSASNSCNVFNTGTINCNGVCSASKPALPAGYGTTCTATNACGASAAGGTKQCDSTCGPVPPLPAGYGTTCTATNACGASATGTYICNGTNATKCSANAPALPANYNSACTSAANACGMKNSGFYGCNGLCAASVPADTVCAPDATITLRANPLLVQKGNVSTINWSSSNTASCTVVGTNGDSWSGTSGSHTTALIIDKTTYTLSCVSVNTKAVTPITATVDIVPSFHEF